MNMNIFNNKISGLLFLFVHISFISSMNWQPAPQGIYQSPQPSMPMSHRQWQFSNQSPQAAILLFPEVWQKEVWSREKLSSMQESRDMAMPSMVMPTYIYTLAGSFSIYVKDNVLYLVKESLDEKVSNPPMKRPMEPAMDIIVLVNPDGAVSLVDRKRKEHPAYKNLIKPTIINILKTEGANNRFDWASLSTESLNDIVKYIDQAGPEDLNSILQVVPELFVNPRRLHLQDVVRQRVSDIRLKAIELLKIRDNEGTLAQVLQGEIGGYPYPLNTLSRDVNNGLVNAINNLLQDTAAQQSFAQNYNINAAVLLKHANALKQRILNHLEGKN